MKAYPCLLLALFTALFMTATLHAANGTIPGTGTEQNPYLIEDYLDFIAFADPENSHYWGSESHIKLTSNITLTVEFFSSTPIAPDMDSISDDFQGIPYEGTFDGNGHTISNLTITNTSNDYIGLFGMIGPGAAVKNLGVENIDITTSSSSIHVGGLAAQNSGTISNCYTKGYIKADNNAGGLCGTNYTGTITNCYSTVSMGVAGSADTFGGFCGYNGHDGLIDRCYFAGNLSNIGNGYSINSFCGYNSQSYPATISNCFWDADVCDWPDDEGYATESTTAEMQTKSTFTDAGWDFSYVDSTPADWIIYPVNYPQLTWEKKIAYSGQPSISKPVGTATIEIDIDVFCPVDQTINWTISGHHGSDIIENVYPEAETSTGPDDITTVTITFTDAMLPEGIYNETLTITANNGDSIDVPLELNIYSPVSITDFAALAQFWLLTDCELPDAPCADADFFIDGTIDISDLNLLTDNWLGIEVPLVKPTPFDGFESGDFATLPWINNDTAPWTVVTDSTNDGLYSARSGPLPGGVYSSLLKLTIDSEFTNISFAVKNQCPSYFTNFYFYIDDEAIEKFSGITDWQTKSYIIEPGEHKFQWFYMNLTPDSDPNKCAWIDDVKLY